VPLEWINEIRTQHPPKNVWKNRWPSSATQFVVGGVDESDHEILFTSEWLFREHGITRAFYSRFNPVLDTPLEDHAPTTHQRQQRLYQAGYLLRDYGFNLIELPFDERGNLPEMRDPKLAWAQHNLHVTPIEINSADKDQLLRIPGIGPLSADRIINTRKDRSLTDLSTLSRMGIAVQRAAPFITLKGKRPKYQMRMSL
jgi:predicted DNA-binding helix-hairpin-helix protein